MNWEVRCLVKPYKENSLWTTVNIPKKAPASSARTTYSRTSYRGIPPRMFNWLLFKNSGRKQNLHKKCREWTTQLSLRTCSWFTFSPLSSVSLVPGGATLAGSLGFHLNGYLITQDFGKTMQVSPTQEIRSNCGLENEIGARKCFSSNQILVQIAPPLWTAYRIWERE